MTFCCWTIPLASTPLWRRPRGRCMLHYVEVRGRRNAEGWKKVGTWEGRGEEGLLEQTFGFSTEGAACRLCGGISVYRGIRHREDDASSAYRGIGIVKLMGRPEWLHCHAFVAGQRTGVVAARKAVQWFHCHALVAGQRDRWDMALIPEVRGGPSLANMIWHAVGVVAARKAMQWLHCHALVGLPAGQVDMALSLSLALPPRSNPHMPFRLEEPNWLQLLQYQLSPPVSSFAPTQVPFCLEGPNGVLQHLEYLLDRQGHAIICVAEGAGQVRGFMGRWT
ncbi:unnamed protein product [Closterium sp. NIES-64]|nr:unnamed protein product [Closterium sp. NIES-64]